LLFGILLIEIWILHFGLQSMTNPIRNLVLYNNMSNVKATNQNNKLFNFSRPSGYSLIELMIAITVITVILVALFLGYSYANRAYLWSRHQIIAYQCLEKEMELIRNTPYANLPSPPFNDQTFLGGITCYGKLKNGMGKLTITWNDPPDNRVKKIDLIITWDDPDSSHQRTVTLNSLVSEGGLND
jgi:prepilin-type N-terminal cleavage/methylation domain-containing protein